MYLPNCYSLSTDMNLKSVSNAKAEAFFVSRAKVTMAYLVVEKNYNIDESTGLRGDKVIQLTGYKSRKLYPENLRIVEYYDKDKEVMLVFLTNNFDVPALEVARLYRNRWQIEVFFKWIKQNLTIKKLWAILKMQSKSTFGWLFAPI